MKNSNQKSWGERSRGQKIGMITGWCVIAAIVLAVVSEDEPAETATASPAGTSQAVAAVQTKSEPVVPVTAAEKPNASEPKKPLDLAEARLFAKGTLRIVNEAEQSLNDGIQLGDAAGVVKHVQKPLQSELERWPTLIDRHPNDQREHFAYCHDAAMRLQTLSYAVQRERTVESMKNLRKDEAEYRKAKQQCEKQLGTTDGQIKAAVAAEDAELKRKFGGRDCLTVYGVDKQTGQVVEQPKPQHCK